MKEKCEICLKAVDIISDIYIDENGKKHYVHDGKCKKALTQKKATSVKKTNPFITNKTASVNNVFESNIEKLLAEKRKSHEMRRKQGVLQRDLHQTYVIAYVLKKRVQGFKNLAKTAGLSQSKFLEYMTEILENYQLKHDDKELLKEIKNLLGK